MNHVDRNLDFFDPPLWTILFNKAYVVKWTFGKPPSPYHVHMVYEWPNRVEVSKFLDYIDTNRSKTVKSQLLKLKERSVPFISVHFYFIDSSIQMSNISKTARNVAHVHF